MEEEKRESENEKLEQAGPPSPLIQDVGPVLAAGSGGGEEQILRTTALLKENEWFKQDIEPVQAAGSGGGEEQILETTALLEENKWLKQLIQKKDAEMRLKDATISRLEETVRQIESGSPPEVLGIAKQEIREPVRGPRDTTIDAGIEGESEMETQGRWLSDGGPPAGADRISFHLSPLSTCLASTEEADSLDSSSCPTLHQPSTDQCQEDFAAVDRYGDGERGLHEAARAGDVAMVKLLMDAGVDINTADAAGRLPLHHAVIQGHPRVSSLIMNEHYSQTPRKSARSKIIKETHMALIRSIHGRQDACLADALPIERMSNQQGKSLGHWYRLLLKIGFDLPNFFREGFLPKVPANASFSLAPVCEISREKAAKLDKDKQNVYRISSHPRGRAIIVNIYEFVHPKLVTRKGAAMDRILLKRCFEQLDFFVEIWDNLTAQQIRDNIEKEQSLNAHSHYSAFIFVILSHGNAHDWFFGRDGNPETMENALHVQNHIIEKFNRGNCKGLRDKPKVFIGQFCRIAGEVCPRNLAKQEKCQGDVTQRPGQAHPDTDVIVIYATCKNHRSFHNELHGSWFIEAFTYCSELFSDKSLTKIIRKAHQYIVFLEDPNDGSVQCPEVYSKAAKKVYFMPGFYLAEQATPNISMINEP